MSVDARRGLVADAPAVADAISNAKGRNEKVSAFFYVSSQLVSGRLTCLIVGPALVIARVTPLPE